jgi:undecaprenyl-diphosphatase
MFEALILGLVQGITEWLPVSSGGVLTLVGMKFFGKDLSTSVSIAVFLHLGTFLAAVIYFRKDIVRIFRPESKTLLRFLILSSLVTAAVAIPLLFFFVKYFNEFSQNFVILFVGIALIVTGVRQFKKPEKVFRNAFDLKKGDGIGAGIWQGLAVLPGLSRSGLTIAYLLLRKFRDSEVLRLSFLMSLPAVLGGNILLNLIGKSIRLNWEFVVSLTTAFVVGFLTIDFLLKISRRINFGWFAILFGLLTLASLCII